MNEAEIETEADAAFFMANEVVNEYHGFPVVQRADFGQDKFYILLNEKWYHFEAIEIKDVNMLERLEALAP
jgi:hypothetical protein